VCAHDGTTLTCIGEDTSEQLDIVPARIKVIVHRRKKYACPCCQQNVVSAPLPAQPIPKAQASAGLLAFIAVSKYLDHLPLYRQAQQWQRLDVAFSRATLANWMIKCGHLVQPLINLLHEHLLGYDLLHMDETRVQVLKEPNKVPSSQSYMWVMKGGPPGQSALLFHYDPSRGQAVPERLLAGYRGILQTDGYEGYGVVQNLDAIRAMGCWAHARRKFDEVIKAQGKTKKGTRKTGKADQALAYIRTLYRIEREAAELDSQQRHAMRQAQAKPVLEQLRNWLDRSLPQVPPQSTLGKALHYLHNQWPKLITYLEDGRIPLDNNAVERAIRPFAIGRKNWLFSNSQAGATASANLYSVLQTAKDNDLDPFDYLKHIFTHLPQAKTVEQIEALLPWNARALNG
jgi:transposase